MGTPYQRQDTTNNIANGNVINANDLDAEFNAIQGAFAVTTGHTHDGTTGEGGPISIVGFGQELTITGNQVIPKTNNTVDLGTSSFKFKDGYIDGRLYADAITILSGDLQTTLDAKQPLDAALTSFSNLVSSADRYAYFTGPDTMALDIITGFSRNLLAQTNATNARSVLGVGSLGTQDAGAVNITGGTITGVTTFGISQGGTGAVTAPDARTNLGLGSLSIQNSNSVTITGGTITGINDLAIADGGTGASSASAARNNLGLAIGTDVQKYDVTLESLADLTDTAFLVRLGTGQVVGRTLTAGSGISVTNGAGGAGDPVISASGITTEQIAPATLVTSSEGIAGSNNDTTIPTTGAVAAYVQNNNFWRFTSTAQTITNGSLLTLAHGLGARPSEVRLVMQCTTAQAPYAVGDEVERTDFSAGGVQYGASITADATNLYIRTGTGGHILINNTGGLFGITNASWRYIARAR